MVEPVTLCGEHRIQVALSAMPEILRDQLALYARPIAVEKLLWNGSHQSVVYFVQNGSRVKIGFTTNIKGRIGTLSLRTNDVLLTLAGGRDLESALHFRFQEYRVGGTEWFQMSQEVRRYITDKRKSVGTETPWKIPAARSPVEETPEREKQQAVSDILTVLGDEDRVRTPEVLHRLKNANYAQYGDWDGGRLRRALTDAGEDTGKYKGYPVVNRDRVERAAERFRVASVLAV